VDTLVFVLCVFVVFFLFVVWFGVIKRSDLANRSDNRASLRVACVMCIFSLLAAGFILLGVHAFIAMLMTGVICVLSGPIYRKIVYKMEGLNEK
jgi:Kef-type K+ transport system membrane component KefB